MQKFGATAKAETFKAQNIKRFRCLDSSVSFAFRLNLSTIYTNDFLHTSCLPLSVLLCPDVPLAAVPLVSDNQQAEVLKSLLGLNFGSLSKYFNI